MSQFHKAVHLFLGSLEVLNTEGVHRDFHDAEVQAPLQSLSEKLRSLRYFMNIHDNVQKDLFLLNSKICRGQADLHGILYTSEPLYNMVHYNMVLDITQIRAGTRMAI